MDIGKYLKRSTVKAFCFQIRFFGRYRNIGTIHSRLGGNMPVV